MGVTWLIWNCPWLAQKWCFVKFYSGFFFPFTKWIITQHSEQKASSSYRQSKWQPTSHKRNLWPNIAVQFEIRLFSVDGSENLQTSAFLAMVLGAHISRQFLLPPRLHQPRLGSVCCLASFLLRRQKKAVHNNGMSKSARILFLCDTTMNMEVFHCF